MYIIISVLFFVLIFVLIGLGLATLGAGLILRVLVTYCSVLGNGFSTKEKVFCTVSWLPKATVQVLVKLY